MYDRLTDVIDASVFPGFDATDVSMLAMFYPRLSREAIS
jgi:hypothetical protein